MRLGCRKTMAVNETIGAARPAGFTLLELVIAMSVLGLISVAIYGVVVLGANSAGAGERITEQARRMRVATDLVARQIRSTEPIKLQIEEYNEPYFIGVEDSLEFVTSIPQRPGSSGLAIVRYWFDHDGGILMMSEVPLFAAMDEEAYGLDDEEFAQQTELLYDIAELRLSYRRDAANDEEWQDEWIAADEDELPAAVRIEIEPATVDGPAWYHEIPVMVGVFNAITDASDFRPVRRASGGMRGRRADRDEDEDDYDEDDEDDDF